LFSDKIIAQRFPEKETKKYKVNNETRNCLILRPKECIEFSHFKNSFFKFGFGIYKKGMLLNKTFQLDFKTDGHSEEQTRYIDPCDFAPGWHDLSINPNNAVPIRKIRITNTGARNNFFSIRESSVKQKNFKYIVVLVVDGISPGSIGVYNNSTITPNIDGFFSTSSSTGYSNAFSQAEWTLPTFASMMTSLYSSQHQVYDPNKYTNTLPREVELLPEILQKAGFATFGYVSHTRCGPRYGYFRGFDEFVYRQVDIHDKHNNNDITKRAVAFLNENPYENKFLFLHYFDTHTPFFPSLDNRIRYKDKKDKLLAAKLEEIDQTIKRIFEAIKKNGALENSLVILTSDHGPGSFSSSDELELDIKETNTRIPFLVYCPWKFNSHTINDMMVEGSIDLLPTVLDAVGMAVPEHAEGRSIFADRSSRKKYAISESVFKDKYELVQRFENHKNYIRLSRDRKKDKIFFENDIFEHIQSENFGGECEEKIMDSKNKLAEWWIAKHKARTDCVEKNK